MVCTVTCSCDRYTQWTFIDGMYCHMFLW